MPIATQPGKLGAYGPREEALGFVNRRRKTGEKRRSKGGSPLVEQGRSDKRGGRGEGKGRKERRDARAHEGKVVRHLITRQATMPRDPDKGKRGERKDRMNGTPDLPQRKRQDGGRPRRERRQKGKGIRIEARRGEGAGVAVVLEHGKATPKGQELCREGRAERPRRKREREKKRTKITEQKDTCTSWRDDETEPSHQRTTWAGGREEIKEAAAALREEEEEERGQRGRRSREKDKKGGGGRSQGGKGQMK